MKVGKILVLLLATIIVKSTAFSQTGTIGSIHHQKNNHIILPRIVAKEVVNDLIVGDSIGVAHKKLKTKTLSKDKIIQLRDSSISSLKKKETFYQSEIKKRDKQIIACNDLSKQLEKNVKKYRRRNTTLSIITVAAIGVATAVVITK